MAPPKIIGWILLAMGCMGFGTSILMLMGMARAKAPDEQGKSNLPPFEITASQEKEFEWEYEEELRHPGFLVAAASYAKGCEVTRPDNSDTEYLHNMPQFTLKVGEKVKPLECSDYCTEKDEKAEEHLERADLTSMTGICLLGGPKESGTIQMTSNMTVSVVDLTEIPPKKEPVDHVLAFTGMAIAIMMLAAGAGYIKWWGDKFG
jgi:hypothetical protein